MSLHPSFFLFNQRISFWSESPTKMKMNSCCFRWWHRPRQFWCSLTLVWAWLLLHVSEEQQIYVNNKQLDCNTNYNYTLGYACNGVAPSCQSYLTFRSNPPYNSPTSIAYLLGSTPTLIATANNISDVDPIPSATVVIVPVNCSCSGPYYQHNASYILKYKLETYFLVSNDTYQGLTTCQSMMAHNSYDFRNLSVQMTLSVPLRCACPTVNQAANGTKFLLTYMVTWKDTISSIAKMFRVAQESSILDANQLSDKSTIYPFTPILVPLQAKPQKIETLLSSAPPAPSPTISLAVDPHPSKKWVIIGVAIGTATLLLISLSALVFLYFRRQSRKENSQLALPSSVPSKLSDSWNETSAMESKNWSISSEGVQRVIDSLIVYKLEDLQKATGFFSQARRIKGSVYKGLFKGDHAAVKVMKGDITPEINVLKRINHRNIIRLSGYCMHLENTYLVYEYADNGSLSDCLHNTNLILSWKQRVQIAYDVADALNYLHTYICPPYIHKNLTTRNILLDDSLRAKISNFGSARTVEDEDNGQRGFQFTRHVVGTQGYMAPEYIDNGLITPKLDVFAFGVVILELLSGKEAVSGKKNGEELLLSTAISEAIDGDNVREKLRGFMDPSLGYEYPLDLAFSMAQLAHNCVARDFNIRPAMSEAFMSISKIFSSSLDWDPSDKLDWSKSQALAR